LIIRGPKLLKDREQSLFIGREPACLDPDGPCDAEAYLLGVGSKMG
jgi:hypothetical protein